MISTIFKLELDSIYLDDNLVKKQFTEIRTFYLVKNRKNTKNWRNLYKRQLPIFSQIL